MSNDETQPTSGSRWEHPEQPEQPVQPDSQQAPPPVAQAVSEQVPGPAYAPAPQPRNRGKLLLAGGAVGIALVAGTGGFALGHATADDERDGPGRFGNMDGRFPGDVPGGGPMGGPQGTFPGQPGQPPGGFQDRRDRDGDDQQLPDHGATQAPPTT